jgi:ubiquinone/menaquinone biosynthesis C-methylase UbiE
MNLSQEIEQRYDRIANGYDNVNLFIPNRWRRNAVGIASGCVLEVGVGTGLNFSYYTTACSEIHGIDLSGNMLRKAAERALSIKIPVLLESMDVQNLRFDDERFDTVVATFVFCTVPDPASGLAECFRVLKPGGRLILLEHVGSRHRCLKKIMDGFNPAAVSFMGDHITRDTATEVAHAGFSLHFVENLFLDVVQIIVGIK